MFVYIEGPNNALAHNYRQEFTYGPGRSRRLVKTYEDGVHIKSRVYAGGVYEEVTDHTSGTTEKHHYVYGGDGLAAILVTQGTTENLYYVHKDYLGSILCLSDESGNVVERYSFDAWGHRRNPSNWSQWDNGTSYITNRVFTGHVREAHVLQGKAGAKHAADTIPPAQRGGKHEHMFHLFKMINSKK